MLGAGNVGRGFLGQLFPESAYAVMRDVSKIRPKETLGALLLAGYRRL
jgi:hypothetical protein